ncbi:hypothetical protein ABID52_003881 [Fictibacillus halophilus]|uniref:Uncharacterized protein n=1 Tax=Fictibacillus halophilus TaxID=1610490 RepID=A0ABV2LNU6_9BACL|nr:hypothetical protein [Fictibacillus halophilus]
MLITNIKLHKKMFEKYDTPKYSVILEGERYTVAGYYLLGLTRGYLLLDESGEVCSREKALVPFKMFIQVNSYVNGFYREGRAEIQKPLHAFQDTIELANEVDQYLSKSKEELIKVKEMINELDQGFKRLKEVYKEADNTFIEINKNEELTQQGVSKIVELKNEFTVLQYKHLNIQLMFKALFQPVLTELRIIIDTLSRREKKNVTKAYDVFSFLTSEKFQNGLKNSLKSFETNGNGKQINFYSMPNWERELITKGIARSEEQFKNELLPMLRN